MVLTQFIFLLIFYLPAGQPGESIKKPGEDYSVFNTVSIYYLGNPAVTHFYQIGQGNIFNEKDNANLAAHQLCFTDTRGLDIYVEKESINWRSRRKLNWNDFKGNPVSTAPNAALTSTSILINFGYDDRSLTYSIQCVFYPQKSWTRVTSPHILAHEQGHFDISQIFTRKLHKALSEYRFRPESVDRDVQKIYQQISEEQAAFQRLYDNETNYSRNPAEQKNWQDRIEKELEDLDGYAGYPQ